MQRHILMVPVFRRERFLATKVKLAVDIIFYQHHVIARQQRHQRRFFFGAKGEAERVLSVSH